MLRDIGGSLGRIRGGMDERDGNEPGGGSLGVGVNRRRDGDAATILTTWSKVLPRTMNVSPSSRSHNGSQRKQKLQTVVKQIQDELGGGNTKSHFEDSRARSPIHPEPSQNWIDETPVYEGKRTKQRFRESERERIVRELKAADERLARVRDGRGSIECDKNQKNGNRNKDTS